MKRISAFSIIALLTLFFVPSLLAQTVPPGRITPRTTTQTVETTPSATLEDSGTRRTEFQDKLKEMTDIRKQAMIERFDEKINNFSKQHTTKLQTGLTRMQSVLDGIATKAATLQDEELDAAIESAQEAIDTAEEAVVIQIEKEYVMDLTDETQIRTAAQEVFTSFKTDLQSVHQVVRETYTAVVEAARLLPKQADRISDDTETSTGEADTMEDVN